MSYASGTTDNSVSIKRYSHAKRFKVALRFIARHDKILDYGAGDGYFLRLAANKVGNPLSCYAYEPTILHELRATLADLLPLSQTSAEFDRFEEFAFDKIFCLEVLEHLPDGEIQLALARFKKSLKRDGKIIISVPIETGISGFLKNMFRLVFSQTHADTNFKNIVRSLFGLEVARPSGSYIPSHIGFNYRNLYRHFAEEGLSVERECFSPFPMFGAVLNSQIFFVLRVA